MQSFINYLKHPQRIALGLLKKIGAYILSDKKYLEIRYFLEMGEPINLNNPRKFSEKIQWLKLYDRKSAYTKMVDKYAVKDYISGLIGEEYIIPTIGVWDRPEDIDYSLLPDKFVLKTTHGGGGNGVIICRDKSRFNKQNAYYKLIKSLDKDIYLNLKEWPYKNVPRRVIAETLIEDNTINELRDYKFFCFNGVCKCFKVDFNRFIEHHANYYDPWGNILNFGEAELPPVYDKEIALPTNLALMVKLAEKLSSSIPFLRVDFYEVQSKIYFGELTFYPASGFGRFTSDKWDFILGEWLELPK